jgi:replicative DNA helicase
MSIEFDPSDAKTPPHSIQAEQAVLGSLLMDNSALDRIAHFLTPSDFYRYDHRLIFIAICTLINNRHPADVITVHDRLQADGKGEQVGGMAYINAIAENTPSAARISHYAEMVRDRAGLRKLMAACDEICRMAAQAGGGDRQQVQDHAEAVILAIGESGTRKDSGFVPLNTLLARAVEKIDEMFANDDNNGVTGIATGFVDLDLITSGLQASDLIIIAGRPSMGKTAFAINIGENVSIRTKQPIAVFSMEMAGTQLAMRMIGSVGKLDQQRLRNGRLVQEDWDRLTHAISKLNKAQMFIDETPALSIMELRARARRLARQAGSLGLVIVDYLQLMSSSTAGGSDNRTAEISEITRGLKSLAKELNCPVIALSQLNRSLENRQNKRPLMSDLRESGSIEQDADVILFIYRDEVYNPESTERGVAEIIIGKQRCGPTGTVRLSWVGQHTRFDNLAKY